MKLSNIEREWWTAHLSTEERQPLLDEKEIERSRWVETCNSSHLREILKQSDHQPDKKDCDDAKNPQFHNQEYFIMILLTYTTDRTKRNYSLKDSKQQWRAHLCVAVDGVFIIRTRTSEGSEASWTDRDEAACTVPPDRSEHCPWISITVHKKARLLGLFHVPQQSFKENSD